MRDETDFERYTASLIVVSGRGAGEEHVVERPRWLVGRGPEVDAAFDDPEMSQHHLRIEFARGRFHAIDLDSTNGTRVNGTGVSAAELAHGDRIHAGGHVFQILIESNEARTGSAGQRAATSASSDDHGSNATWRAWTTNRDGASPMK